MNEIVYKFLLAGDEFIPECIKDSQDLLAVLVDHSLKIKKKWKI